MQKKLVIFGTSQIAELACFYFTNDSNYTVAAFTVDSEYIKDKSILGYPLVPFDSLEKEYPPKEYDLFIALSYREMNELRKVKYLEAKEKGYNLASYISSDCVNYSNGIGDNCFILENNTIQPFVDIGNNVTIWSGNHIGHHSNIGDHTFISSHVVISGDVTIEQCCFLGVNSTIGNGVKIERNNLIGARAWINNSTKEYAVYVDAPTKKFPKTSDRVKL